MSTFLKPPSPTLNHPVVPREEWLAARKSLLLAEKEVTRRLDALRAQRRELPWVKLSKNYLFESPAGRETLSDLFGSNSQLVVYHFMFGPGWKDGCPGCSFLSDHIDGANLHLVHHDVSLVVVSRAPWPELQPFKKRMGWHFKWVSSFGSDFNYDYHVSATEEELKTGRAFYNFEMSGANDELPGISVFYKDTDGAIYHTYSAYARGGDSLIGAHHYLDLTPKGRNESTTMNWVRHHDKYGDGATFSCCSGRDA